MSVGRVIGHIDLDAFYAQVEAKRLGIANETTPVAVQQWTGLIAVNYAARAKGVTRHMRVHEALKVCPGLICVHVETLGGDKGGGEGEGEGEGQAAAARGAAGPAGPGPGSAAPAPGPGGAAHVDKSREKASLERYRRESKLILGLLEEVAGPRCIFEKGGLDEAFIDLSHRVDDELAAGVWASDAASCGAAPPPGWVIVGGPLDLGLDGDRRLARGAALMASLRAAVWEKLGYTCSAGVATNKLLAKLGSARNKPNMQSIITTRGADEVMRDTKVSKIRFFGGKIGEVMESLGCVTAGDAQALSLEDLSHHFGPERAAHIHGAVRGLDSEAVKPRARVKSFMAAKSFAPVGQGGWAELERWLSILSDELAARLLEEEEDGRRIARSFHLQYRGSGGDKSKSCGMPRVVLRHQSQASASIAACALGLLRKCDADIWPCSRVAISATDLVDIGGTTSLEALFARAPGPGAGAAQGPGGTKATPEASPLPSPGPPARAMAAAAPGARQGGTAAAAAAAAGKGGLPETPQGQASALGRGGRAGHVGAAAPPGTLDQFRGGAAGPSGAAVGVQAQRQRQASPQETFPEGAHAGPAGLQLAAELGESVDLRLQEQILRDLEWSRRNPGPGVSSGGSGGRARPGGAPSGPAAKKHRAGGGAGGNASGQQRSLLGMMLKGSGGS